MGKKEIVREVLDWDQGIVATFLTLFTDPKKVATNPDKFTRPWKYATYVASISCLFTWFVIHFFVDTQDQESFWLMPKRMLELLTGYQNFYENTQPLKRLVLGAVALYIAMTIFLFKERNQPPGFLTVCLYTLGHSVFIVFILQSVGVLFVGRWDNNAVVIIGIGAHVVYLTYAIVRILGQLKWTTILFKGIGIFLIQFTLYTASSTRLVHYFYYGVLHRNDLPFRITPDQGISHNEAATNAPIETKKDISSEFRKEETFDSLKIISECAHPSGQEVAKITLSCFSKSNQRWSIAIFEKTNRYSPDPHEVFLRVDAASHTAFVSYRISNDSNATIQMVAVDVATGKRNYTTSLQTRTDGMHLNDVAMDSSSVYICGSTQDKFDNFDLGMIGKIDKRTGKVIGLKQLGSNSFASWTSFQRIKVSPQQLSLLVKRDYKWMFLFNKTSWSVWTLEKSKL